MLAAPRRTLAVAAPVAVLALLALLPLGACDPLGRGAAPAGSGSAAASASPSGPRARTRPAPPRPVEKRKVSARPVATVKPNPDDPQGGKWTLEEATAGLPPGNALWANIQTTLGTLECKLFPDKAPNTVANFVGLARGLRPWKTPEGNWEKKPLYDGTIFHRVIPGFLVQGGDPKGDGTGEAGYVIPDEVWEDANHDRAGLLCMANRGADTGSAQFFVTDGAALHLDGGYTIFGECTPLDVVHAIANAELGRGDRPEEPPVIERVTIARKAGGAVAPASSTSGGASASPSGSAAASAAASAGPAASAAAGPGATAKPAGSSAAPPPAPKPTSKPAPELPLKNE